MPDSQYSFFKLLLIFLGSGFGGLLRYTLGGVIHNWYGPSFPLGTLVINVSGCLAMGFLATIWTGPILIREDYRAAVLIGILGGYTTFSSFGRETLLLAQDGQWLRAGIYVTASVMLSLFAVWLGSAFATKVYGTGGL